MTTVTGASRFPHVGSLLEMGTGESSSLQVPPPAAEAVESAPISPFLRRCESYPHMRPAPEMKQRMKPTMATPVFIPEALSKLLGDACSVSFLDSFDMIV